MCVCVCVCVYVCLACNCVCTCAHVHVQSCKVYHLDIHMQNMVKQYIKKPTYTLVNDATVIHTGNDTVHTAIYCEAFLKGVSELKTQYKLVTNKRRCGTNKLCSIY